MTKTDREICETATPGPWTEKGLSSLLRFGRKHSGPWGYECDDSEFLPDDNDAQYIAHFNPARVAKMLDEIEQLKAELRELQGIYCHTLAYKEDTIFDKMSALQIAEHFGYKCFEQPKEQGDE